VKISFLELFDDNIGPKGAHALGSALSFGHNLSLLTLKLDYNATLSDEGVANLCKGLRTNSTLKQLHLQFCNLTSPSGKELSELLANSKSALELLNLNGNRIGGKGLQQLCTGLMQNLRLETLLLADNMIDQVRLNCYDTLTLYCLSLSICDFYLDVFIFEK
jgi:Ran GTPase-activating protein (RanGAP) involved in mRNA processing and transport